jgi:hypothetical protein
MDTLSAYAMGMANRGREMKVFDWDKAVDIILSRNPQHADAGLVEDWSWTAGSIYEYGKPVSKEDYYAHLCSTWATPVLRIDDETIECWIMESQIPKEWGDTDNPAHYYFPGNLLERFKRCKYCNGLTGIDSKGNCAACGAQK